MHMRRRDACVRPTLLLVFTASGCNGPLLVLPGGRLEGEVKPSPSDWSFAGDYGTVQLETRPEEPYSVNIAFTVIEGSLYVKAGNTETPANSTRSGSIVSSRASPEVTRQR